MVSTDDYVDIVTNPGSYFVRVWPVPDDVAETKNRLILAGRIPKHRFEGLPVRVNIAEDKKSHLLPAKQNLSKTRTDFKGQF